MKDNNIKILVTQLKMFVFITNTRQKSKMILRTYHPRKKYNNNKIFIFIVLIVK